MPIYDTIKIYTKYICEVIGIYILWIILHYVSANLYPYFCAELGIWGFIQSIFVAESPHCIAMRWMIYNGGNVIHVMWISLGVWIVGKILWTPLN